MRMSSKKPIETAKARWSVIVVRAASWKQKMRGEGEIAHRLYRVHSDSVPCQ